MPSNNSTQYFSANQNFIWRHMQVKPIKVIIFVMSGQLK